MVADNHTHIYVGLAGEGGHTGASGLYRLDETDRRWHRISGENWTKR